MSEKLSYKELAQYLEKAKAGDNSAFSTIYSATFKAQYFQALRRLKDPALADDAVQEVYLVLYRNMGTIRNNLTLVSYLNSINSNTCQNIIRKELDGEKKVELEKIAPIMADPQKRPDEIASENAEKSLVYQSLSMMDPTLSDVLVLRFIEEKTIKDIATELNLSSRTVKRYIKKGAAEMRTIIENLKSKVLSLSIFAVPYAARLLRAQRDTVSNQKQLDIYSSLADKAGTLTATSEAAAYSLLAVGTSTGTGLLAIGLVGGLALAGTGGTLITIPNYTLTPTSDTQTYTGYGDSYTVKTEGSFQLGSVQVFDEQNELVTQGANFLIEHNGTYTIVIHGLTGAEAKETVVVTNIDRECPELSPVVNDGATISFSLVDSLSGVDWDSIVMTYADGTSVPYSLQDQTISYPNNGQIVNFVVYDYCSNKTTSEIKPYE